MMAFLRTLTSTRLGLLAGDGASRSTLPVLSSLQHLHSTSTTPQFLPSVSGCHPSGYGGFKEEHSLTSSVLLRNFTHSGNPEDPPRLWNYSCLGSPNVGQMVGLFTPRLGNSLHCTGYRRVPSQMMMMLKNNSFATESKGKKAGSNPGKSKFPKQMKGTMKGIAHQGTRIAFGAYGLQVLEHSWITSRQIEAGRRAIIQTSRRAVTSARGGGKLWVRIFPDKPVTGKPAEVRMGRGKGAHSYWVAVVKPGRIVYEMNGVTETTARRAISIAASKMPVRCQFISLAR